jgi:hypothetical protein
MLRRCPLRYGPYRVPDETGSDVAHARYHHDDLAASDLDEIALTAELLAATWALGRIPRYCNILDREWLLERHARLRRALRRMQAASTERVDQ